MAFSLTRPPSPSRDGHISAHNDDDHISSALHAALSSLIPGFSTHPDHPHDMIKEKEKAGINIVVDSDCLSLKGTSADVEPALLKGHIILHLKEPTSIKEITLQFRGKAKLPLPSAADTLPLGGTQWYSICNHEWSFLEGGKRHGHTLKAGLHRFPFQLQLGGSLPSTLSSAVYGGAHITYKLRAVAVRPGLAHNLQAVMPISIIRTFAPVALEYQQSLEIESTWPDKLMYSILLPHKAWAAGDQLTAIVKFSPLSKGVRVLTVTTTIHEITKLHCRSGVQEHTRSVVTLNQEISANSERHFTGSATPSLVPGPIRMTPSLSSEYNQDLTIRHVSSRASSSSSSLSHESQSVPPLSLSSSVPSAYSAELVTTTSMPMEEEIPISEDEVVAYLTLPIPKTVTPSHTLEPITVSHRIRWSILMSNLDGHTSELRCSLPLHILDPRLLDEARANSAATRRLLLGGPEVPDDEEQDVELPCYSAHVRDRVANMYLPDSATTRVLNPWVHSNNASPTFRSEPQPLSGTWSPSHASSPLMPHPVSSYLPHIPHSGTNTPLEWVDSELLLSLSNAIPPVLANVSPHLRSPDSTSRPGSRPVSRRDSRAPSPDRHLTQTTTNTLPVPPMSTSHEAFVHDGHASRTLPTLFRIQMKPQSSLVPAGWLSSRSRSHSNLASLADQQRGLPQGCHISRRPSVPILGSQVSTPTPGTAERVPESLLWHRAFTEVPDYDVASRGFIGGVTPLTSMRGLPSYEEAEPNVQVNGGNGNGSDGDEGRLTIQRTRSTRAPTP